MNNLTDKEIDTPEMTGPTGDEKDKLKSASQPAINKVTSDQLTKINRRHQQFSYASEAQAKRLESQGMQALGREVAARNKQRME